MDINAAPSGNNLFLSFSGSLKSITLVNYIGNEGNFIVLDQNGDVLNLSGSGTTRFNALILDADDTVSARVGDVLNPEDYYTFSAPTDGQVTATISGAAAGAVVRFFNVAGGSKAFATADSNGDAVVTIDAVRSETYFVSVTHSTDTAYTMDLSFAEQNTSDSVSNPVNVSLPLLLDSVALSLASNPVEAYRIVAPSDMTLIANTSHVTGDLDLRIYDSAGNLLKESAQTGTVAEGLSFQITAGEAYIIEFVARDPTVTANIQLTLEELDDTGTNGLIATADAITIGTGVTGDAGLNPNFADYYTFTVATAGDVTVTLNGLQDDLRIDLFDSDGVRIGQAQNAGTTPELLV